MVQVVLSGILVWKIPVWNYISIQPLLVGTQSNVRGIHRRDRLLGYYCTPHSSLLDAWIIASGFLMAP